MWKSALPAAADEPTTFRTYSGGAFFFRASFGCGIGANLSYNNVNKIQCKKLKTYRIFLKLFQSIANQIIRRSSFTLRFQFGIFSRHFQEQRIKVMRISKRSASHVYPLWRHAKERNRWLLLRVFSITRNHLQAVCFLTSYFQCPAKRNRSQTTHPMPKLHHKDRPAHIRLRLVNVWGF